MERREDFGAFVQRFELPPASPPSPSHELPLRGLTFAVKDIFDISGYVTGFGNPDWARTHATAISTAPAVLAIIEGGATCIGKTVMDEMAYSINGENKHYGTPINPCAPDRVPGGSSSGSAVAVAAELVDFSIGTDTGGSVRVPAAYCGIFGFRPSHAVVKTEGVIPMAQSFDTVGWFARDPITLNKVGRVLLQSPPDTPPAGRIIIPDDCFHCLSFPSGQVSVVLTESIEKTFGSHVVHHTNLGDYISNEVPSLKYFTSESNENQESTIPALLALSNALRLLQRYEFKHNHGEWVNTVRPDLGPGISERVWEAVKSTENSIDHCLVVKSELRAALNSLLEKNGVIAIPTVPGPPPKLLTKLVMLESFRARAFSLLAIAGMSGFCQVTVPLGMHDNVPVSISLLARHGADHFLLDLVQTLYGTLREQASISGKLGC